MKSSREVWRLQVRLRFDFPLFEPDVRVSRIRLSDQMTVLTPTVIVVPFLRTSPTFPRAPACHSRESGWPCMRLAHTETTRHDTTRD